MRDHFISLTWGGQSLTNEQEMVAQRVAVLLLRQEGKRDSIDFDHFLIAGRVTHLGFKILAGVRGHAFHADFGEVRKERWFSDFIIRKGAEETLLKGDDIGQFVVEDRRTNERSVVDPTYTGVTEDVLL